jgi:hypothetical protein
MIVPAFLQRTFAAGKAGCAKHMACALFLGALASAASAVDSAVAATNASLAGATDLARLQALIKELEPATPVPAVPPTFAQLPPEPVVEEAPREVTIKSASRESFPNAETEGNVMVFDEAEASVERALRRLAPSPGAQPKPVYNIPVAKTSQWCEECHDFYNGAADIAGATMCKKKSTSSGKTACYANHNGCPEDMEAYTCGDHASPPPAPTTECVPSRVQQYDSDKAKTLELMKDLISLKEQEQELTLMLIADAEQHATCACAPVDKVAQFIGAA